MTVEIISKIYGLLSLTVCAVALSIASCCCSFVVVLVILPLWSPVILSHHASVCSVHALRNYENRWLAGLFAYLFIHSFIICPPVGRGLLKQQRHWRFSFSATSAAVTLKSFIFMWSIAFGCFYFSQAFAARTASFCYRARPRESRERARQQNPLSARCAWS